MERHRAVTAALIASAAVMLMLWGATSGDPLLSAPSNTFASPNVADQRPDTAEVTEEPSVPTTRRGSGDGSGVDWGLLLQIVIAALLAWAVIRWFRNRQWAEAENFVQVEPVNALAELVDATSVAVDSTVKIEGEPRNMVVACWVALEAGLTRSGLAPGPAETSVDVTRRVMHSWDVDPAALDELALLYREARFSRHPMTPAQGQRAVAILADIHSSLRRAAEVIA